jgi:hypothetical protein
MQPEEIRDETLLQPMLAGLFRFVPQLRQAIDYFPLLGRLPLMRMRIGQVIPGIERDQFVLSDVIGGMVLD